MLIPVDLFEPLVAYDDTQDQWRRMREILEDMRAYEAATIAHCPPGWFHNGAGCIVHPDAVTGTNGFTKKPPGASHRRDVVDAHRDTAAASEGVGEVGSGRDREDRRGDSRVQE